MSQPVMNGDRCSAEDELEFIQAIEHYKRANRRPFPTWSEVLGIAKALGYRKLPASPLPVEEPHPANDADR